MSEDFWFTDIKKQDLINLTPHDVVIYSEDGKNVKMKIPSAGILRVPERIGKGNETLVMEGVEVVKIITKEYLQPSEELPPEREGVYYIVSLPVALAMRGRKDLLVPDTGIASAVRDSEGRIIGVRRFMRIK